VVSKDGSSHEILWLTTDPIGQLGRTFLRMFLYSFLHVLSDCASDTQLYHSNNSALSSWRPWGS